MHSNLMLPAASVCTASITSIFFCLGVSEERDISFLSVTSAVISFGEVSQVL